MNREEAIEIIRKEYLCVDRDCDIEKNCGKCDLMMPNKEPILEAYKMAIKALEQMPVTTTAGEGGVIYYPQVEGVTPTVIDVGKQEPTEFEEIDFVQEHKKIPVTLDLTPCEDAISRQAVLEYINRILNQGMGKKKSFEFIQKYVEKLPPVNPTKTGHWIYKQYGGYQEQGDYHCSECDKIDNHIPEYCPHCGCAMVEPQERSGEE